MRTDSGKLVTFVPFNAKVADITHGDVNKHEITLATLGLPENVVVLELGVVRVVGTGSFLTFPNEGATDRNLSTETRFGGSIGIINQRLQYRLSVINDDFDVYCFGYWLEF